MESLSDDILGLVVGRVSNGGDRKSCSQVSTKWYAIEALTRTRVFLSDHERLPHLLARFRNLTTLEFGMAVPISDEALMFVAELCPNLRTLRLESSSSSFGDDGLIAVARGCSRLEEVFLSSSNVSDEVIIALQMYAKHLAVLHLTVCTLITDMSLAAVGDMESISELYFVHCLITDNGLLFLSSRPASLSLRVLSLCCCELITDVGVLHLRRMSRLEELDLSFCSKVNDVGVAVSALSNLKKLFLSQLKEISDETLFALAKGCRKLVVIRLDGCERITGRGVVSLASSLPLELIDVSGMEDRHKISCYHVMQIAERCPSLKYLTVDRELEEALSPLQREKLNGLAYFGTETIFAM